LRAIDAIYTLAPQIDFTVSFGKTAAIMAASVAANAVLVALIVTRAPSLFHLPQFLPPAGAAVAQSSPPLRPSPPGFPPGLFGELDKGDLKSVIARYRAAGASPLVLRAIATEKINGLIYAKRKELAAQMAPRPYWSRNFQRMDPKVMTAMNALNKEQAAMFKGALGPDAEYLENDPLSQAMIANQNGGLPKENIERIRAIQSDYNDLKSEIMGSMNGVTLSEDYEKLAYLEKEQQADMAKALSPNDLFEYQLRNSPTASVLRSNLQAFNPTEEEFRVIFKAQLDFDQKYGSPFLVGPTQRVDRQAHEAELQDNIQDALGSDRFAEYKQETDPGYMATSRLVERLELPSTAGQEVQTVQGDISKRADSIKKDSSLSPSDKSAVLAALADEASSKLTAVLGERGLAAYKQTGGWWIQNINPPSK